MAFELLVGLQVTDAQLYQAYREAMRPILERYGGGFSYDFSIAEVLFKVTDEPINRVFTIYFRDEDAMKAFFADADYVDARQRYFEQSVAATTIIARYVTDR